MFPCKQQFVLKFERLFLHLRSRQSFSSVINSRGEEKDLEESIVKFLSPGRAFLVQSVRRNRGVKEAMVGKERKRRETMNEMR